jgi:hypothetical protein
MLRRDPDRWMVVEVVLVCSFVLAGGQTPSPRRAINLIVIDENGLPVSGAEVTLSEPALSPMQCRTGFAGRCAFALPNDLPYQLRVQKQGFYEAVENQADAHLQSVEVKLAHEQVVLQEVDVVPSPGGIDLEQISDKSTFDTEAIVNLPYPTSRDVRNLLPFTPGVVQDGTGQIHVAGSETYATLDLLDGFDIRFPASGQLAMRVSADAVRSISSNPAVVNNVVDSPQFHTFSEFPGRALTARIRLITSR